MDAAQAAAKHNRCHQMEVVEGAFSQLYLFWASDDGTQIFCGRTQATSSPIECQTALVYAGEFSAFTAMEDRAGILNCFVMFTDHTIRLFQSTDSNKGWAEKGRHPYESHNRTLSSE